VLKVIAKEKLALATGHSSPGESLMLIREARRLGIARIVVTHPLLNVVNMSISEMRKRRSSTRGSSFAANKFCPLNRMRPGAAWKTS